VSGLRRSEYPSIWPGHRELEKTVVEEFPQARVLRWDTDTTRFKGAHDLILDHFSQHRADILIGTKMLAKGLDLPWSH